MPRWKELKRFCDRDGWELYKDLDCNFNRKVDNDGNIWMTKISKESGEIHAKMWKEILGKQLKDVQKYFISKFYNEIQWKAFGEI